MSAIVKSLLLFSKSCFSKIWNRQFLVFLLFLFLSASFWTFQALNETYEKEFLIPLELRNIPSNVVITTDLPTSVKITLRDKGVALLNYKVAREFKPVAINYADYSSTSGHVVVPREDILRQIATQLFSTTQIVDAKPEVVDFYFNFGGSKRVPVRFMGHLKAETDYYVSSLRFSPDSVTVFAVRSVLDTIKAAYIRPLFLGGLKDTLSRQTTFQTIRGAKFVPEKVSLILTVDRLVEKTVQVPIQWINFPASKQLRTFPSKVNITFLVGMKAYNRITADNFVLVVNYEDLLSNNGNRCRLSLKSTPEGASRIRISPQDVEYVIEETISTE